MRVMFLARHENAGLIKALLERGHQVYIPDAQAPAFRAQGLAVNDVALPDDPNTKAGYRRLPITEKIRCVAAIAPQVVDAVTRLRPDALLVWTDAPPLPRLAALAARARGIPTFEVTHGAFNTYRQGHFEYESYVDYVLAPGQEEADFRAFYGSSAHVVPVGKPTYDWIASVDKQRDRQLVAEGCGLPSRRPIVLYGMTWRHPFSTWERDGDLGEWDVFRAHSALIGICKPYLIVKPHPVMSRPEDAQRIKRACEEAGLTEYAVTTLPVSSLLPACDLVVSHKSSLLVEAVLLDIPAVGFDFREWNDQRFYLGRGIEWVEQRDQLLAAMTRCLLDAPTKERLATERQSAKTYFNSANDGKATERCVSTIERLVAERMAA